MLTNLSERDYPSDANETYPIKPNPNSRLECCIAVLKNFDKGVKHNRTVLQLEHELDIFEEVFQIPKSTFEKWINSAKLIRKIHTEKGPKYLRLFPKGTTRICPIPPVKSLEKLRAEKMIASLRQQYLNYQKEITWFCSYTLTHVQYAHSYIRFSSVEDYEKFIRVAMLFSSPASWELEVDSPKGNGRMHLKWKSFNSDIKVVSTKTKVKKEGVFPHGRGRLYFLDNSVNLEASHKAYTRYSSNAIKYISHVLAIMLGIEF